MRYLAIIGTDVTDPNWTNDYIEKVTPMVIACGGKYLTRTDNVELIEGESKPEFSVVAEFPSREIALAFYHSDEYAPYKSARLAGSVSTFILVPIENEAT